MSSVFQVMREGERPGMFSMIGFEIDGCDGRERDGGEMDGCDGVEMDGGAGSAPTEPAVGVTAMVITRFLFGMFGSVASTLSCKRITWPSETPAGTETVMGCLPGRNTRRSVPRLASS
jgi:hypothetical protein